MFGQSEFSSKKENSDIWHSRELPKYFGVIFGEEIHNFVSVKYSVKLIVVCEQRKFFEIEEQLSKKKGSSVNDVMQLRTMFGPIVTLF